MAKMSQLEIDIIETYKNNKDILPIELIINDLANRYCISREAMAYEVSKLLSKETDGGMSLSGNTDISKDYVEYRWKGHI